MSFCKLPWVLWIIARTLDTKLITNYAQRSANNWSCWLYTKPTSGRIQFSINALQVLGDCDEHRGVGRAADPRPGGPSARSACPRWLYLQVLQLLHTRCRLKNRRTICRSKVRFRGWSWRERWSGEDSASIWFATCLVWRYTHDGGELQPGRAGAGQIQHVQHPADRPLHRHPWLGQGRGGAAVPARFHTCHYWFRHLVLPTVHHNQQQPSHAISFFCNLSPNVDLFLNIQIK